MFNQRSIVILFINRNQFQLFGGSLTGVVTLDVPDVIIHDLEVLQKDGLYTLIKQWVKQYALAGSQILIIFSSSSYFEKILPTAGHEQIESNILKFFDTVPYESIWTKVYPAEKGKRAVAVNKTLYETIHQGFSLQGVPTKAVILAFALESYANKTTLDQELAQYIFKNLDGITKNSLLDAQELGFSTPAEVRQTAAAPKVKSNLPLLLGAFGFLILILIIMIVTNLL